MADPRPTFIPIPGQSFSCQQDWINRANRRLTAHPEYCNTAHPVGKRDKGWRGDHFTALCFDQKGIRMRRGADFQRAEDEGTYPVWWVWPDQIFDLLKQGVELSPSKPSEPVCPRCRNTGYLDHSHLAIDPCPACNPGADQCPMAISPGGPA